jgi:hypothetical protein
VSIRRKLNISFPYDWSNPNMSKEVLIAKVIERGIFEDIAKISIAFGIESIEPQVAIFLQENPFAKVTFDRMIANIKRGLKKSETHDK